MKRTTSYVLPCSVCDKEHDWSGFVTAHFGHPPTPWLNLSRGQEMESKKRHGLREAAKHWDDPKVLRDGKERSRVMASVGARAGRNKDSFQSWPVFTDGQGAYLLWIGYKSWLLKDGEMQTFVHAPKDHPAHREDKHASSN